MPRFSLFSRKHSLFLHYRPEFHILIPALLRLKHQPIALLAVIWSDFQLLQASFTARLRLNHTHKQFLAVTTAESLILQVSFVAS